LSDLKADIVLNSLYIITGRCRYVRVQIGFFKLKVFNGLLEEDQGCAVFGFRQQLLEMSQVALNFSAPDAHCGSPARVIKTHLGSSNIGALAPLTRRPTTPVPPSGRFQERLPTSV
jgi:hypothetical protein